MGKIRNPQAEEEEDRYGGHPLKEDSQDKHARHAKAAAEGASVCASVCIAIDTRRCRCGDWCGAESAQSRRYVPGNDNNGYSSLFLELHTAGCRGGVRDNDGRFGTDEPAQ